MSTHMQVRQDTDFTVFARVGIGPFFEFVDEVGELPVPLDLNDVAAAERYARFLCRNYGFTTVSFECTTRLTCEEETAR